jgi:hypothetical protein
MVRVFAGFLAIAVLFATAPFDVFAAASHLYAGPAPVSAVERAQPDQRSDPTGYGDRSCSIATCVPAFAAPGVDGMTPRRLPSPRTVAARDRVPSQGVALSAEPPVPRIALFRAR